MLGTAQLGADYGIANRTGRPDAEEAEDILERAWRVGVRILDTARSYGDSETVIGAFLERNPECPFAVISKLEAGVDLADAGAVETAVRESRDRIGRPLEGMLLLNAAMLSTLSDGGRDAFRRCIANGLVAAVGVSVYTPEEFKAAMTEDTIDIIQAPFNALDRRLIDQGLIQRAVTAGKQVFLRSVYLQGLLLMEPADLPPAMAFAAEPLTRWRRLCADYGLPPLAGALGFVRAVAPDAHIVVGCESAGQIDAAAAGINPPHDDFLSAVAALATCDPNVVDPRAWPDATT